MKELIESLKRLDPLYVAVYNVFFVICKLLLIADILITCYVVLSRYVPFIPTAAWGEEIILTLMAYMAVLSASLAIRRNAHIRMTAFDRYLPKNVIKGLDLAADIGVFVLAVIMIVVGMQYSLGIGAKGYYSSMPWLSKFWMYFTVPLAGVAMLFFELERIVVDLGAFYGVEFDIEEQTEDYE